MTELPAELAAIADENVVQLDVREVLRGGGEPFSEIMAARARVPAGGALSVRAIFEPAPLYAVMRKQGFQHFTQMHAEDDWQVWFYPAQAAADVASPASPKAQPQAPADPNVTVLDVRGLEPPEPMVRTLEAVEKLPEGGTLVQINARVPQFLLPMLEERGFTYEIREQEPGLVRVFIRRAKP